MGVFAKVALSLFVVVVGAVIAGVAKEMIGYGQYWTAQFFHQYS